MRMISCDTHIIRKALRLSLNEMAVLCDIHQMSQNPRYNYWCVKSKDKMAEWIDISRDTVFRAIDALKQKGYVISNDEGHLRCTQFIYDIETAQDEIAILIRNNDTELLSAKMTEIMAQSENATTPSENATIDSSKTRLLPSENATQDIQEINIENNNKNICVTGYTFELFWEDYGVKKNKHEAQKKFNKLSPKDKNHIQAIMPQYKLDTPEIKFRKHPSTFLNQKTWLDYDITEPKTTTAIHTNPTESRYWSLMEIIKQRPHDNGRFTYEERKFIISCQQSFDRNPPEERKLLSDTCSLTRAEINEREARENG